MYWKTYLIFCILFCSCSSQKKVVSNSPTNEFTSINISPLGEVADLSVRAIVWNQDLKRLYFSGSKNSIGFIDHYTGQQKLTQLQVPDSLALEFRAIDIADDNQLFVLSAGNPALIYRVSPDLEQQELVYQEEGEEVFYDALHFVNSNIGFVLGDQNGACINILKTTDAGNHWNKIDCSDLPATNQKETAFAASNTNIASVDNFLWLATTNKVVYSNNWGRTWALSHTPIIQDLPTQGIYSIDFYDDKNGIAIGGNYSAPKENENNMVVTTDGGKNWEVLSGEHHPGYRSCIRWIPNGDAQKLITVGFEGIDLSNNGGKSWQHLSEESFYTIEFNSPNSGYLAGRGRIAAFELK